MGESIRHSPMWHILHDYSEHMRFIYSEIYGKEIYPVAINDFDSRAEYIFRCKARYEMIR